MPKHHASTLLFTQPNSPLHLLLGLTSLLFKNPFAFKINFSVFKMVLFRLPIAFCFHFSAATVREPEANEWGSSLIGKKLHFRGIQSLFLVRCKELWLCTNKRFRMHSALTRNCGYAEMGDLECAVDCHILSSYTDFQLQFE